MRANLLWTKLRTVGVGLIGTLLVALAFQMGRLDLIELVLNDVRFREFSRVTDSNRVCIVGVDDGALESVGQWPWPRRYLAEIIDIVGELGADQIALDFTYTRPQSISGTDPAEPSSAFDNDRIFADVCRRQGKVTLACFFNQPVIIPEVVSALEGNIDLDPDDLADQLALELATLRSSFAGLQRQAARNLANRALAEDPSLSKSDFLREVLENKWLRQSNARRQLAESYDYARAYMTVRDKAGWALHGPAATGIGVLPHSARMVVPIPPFADAASDCGFVSYKADLDGKVRTVTLLAEHDQRIYRQLALAALTRYLHVGPDGLVLSDGTMTLTPNRKGEKPIHIPLSDDGKVIVDWYYPKSGMWRDSFTNQISAGYLHDLALNRQALAANRYALNFAIDIAVSRFLPQREQRYQKLKKGLALLEQAPLPDTRPVTETAPSTAPTTSSRPTTATATFPASLDEDLATALARTRRELNTLIDQAKEQLQFLYEQIKELPPEEQGDPENLEIVALWRCVHHPDQVREINAATEAVIQEKLSRLRPMIEGKIVLIGYTAATLADFVATPVFDRCPGVLVHANIINQILTRSFRVPSSRNVDLLVILTLGMLVSVLTAQRSALEGLFWMLIFFVSFLWISSYFVFGKLHVICNQTGPILAIFFSWAGVTMYRQITEGRSKRLFASRLRQYTSPALVKRIVEDPDKLVLLPQRRVVTCFFSDIAGFTPVSERLGPEETVRLLNIYLEHMSEILDRHEGFINKFQGDGIFAFFNPPLNPQTDHARRACLAAIDSQQYMAHIQEHLVEDGFSLPVALTMRVGISTGPVVVGDCGSARKFDYTCLGDTVNLASRLEAANKFFDSRIMICQAAKDEMGDDLLVRLLGKIRVVGREQPVVVYELIGRIADRQQHTDYVNAFSDMVRAYWRADFQAAGDAVTQLKQAKLIHDTDGDKAVTVYEKLIRQMIESDGQDHRDGVIELESK